MFEVTGLTAGYGKLDILHDVSLTIATGESVAVFGRNGAGKTTMAGALLGTVKMKSGTVQLDDTRLDRFSTDRIVGAGLALVPQSRGLFSKQSVEANLRLACFGAHLRRSKLRNRIDEIFDLFPALVKRRDVTAASLSGGEQQMLAIARALVPAPAVIILDEPSIGLAPRIVDDVAKLMVRLQAEGVSFLVAEQNITWLTPLISKYYMLEQGHIVEQGTTAGGDAAIKKMLTRYLGETA